MANVICDDFASGEGISDDFLSTSMEDNDKREKEKDQEGKNDSKNKEDLEQANTASVERKNFDPLGPVPDNMRNVFESMASSDYVSDRIVCAKSILEQLYYAESKEDILEVIFRMCKLGEDEEPVVRTELLNSLPYIALFCKQHSEDLNAVIRQQVVPYAVKQLTDEDLTIRKFAHFSLLLFTENKILDNSQLEDWICPLLAELVMSDNSSIDFRSEDVTVMCQVVPHIEKEITKKFFLSPFVSLCCDSAVAIRKVCAIHFGTFCQVFETSVVEATLLPAFLNLCNDEVPDIRKECTSMFATVAESVTPGTRREILPHYFISLLNDEFGAVKIAAYMALGKVISTFSNSLVNVNIIKEPKKDTQNNNDCVKQNQDKINQEQELSVSTENNQKCNEIQSCTSNNNCSEERTSNQHFRYFNLNNCSKEVSAEELTANKSINTNTKPEVENNYNHFQFWRTPLPEIVPDIDPEPNISRNSPPSNNTQQEKKSKKHEVLSPYDQDIIPPELLISFISGVENNPSDFAYNFCAVAQTLGKKNWSCIRNIYFKFANNEREYVRATVACFIHELAAILGHDLTLQDLLPVYLLMSRDSEKVRLKVLTYLSRFLQHLKPLHRKLFLPFIKELLDPEAEAERSWRYRFIVAKQLIPCVPLFDLSEIQTHFLPIALTLMNDKACDVRRTAIKLFSVIIKSFFQHSDLVYNNTALSLLTKMEEYKKSKTWLQRQMYVYICEELATYKSIPEELYIEKIVPNLLFMAWDTVPNVRLSVARCICSTLFSQGLLQSIHKSQHQHHLLQVMFSLQSDPDRDVRHFAQLTDKTLDFLTNKLSPV